MRDLEHVASLQDTKPVVGTVFFGGGTHVADERPRSRRGARHGSRGCGRRRTTSRSRSNPIPPAPIAGRFADYRAAGVNRLSLGVQALNDANLKQLGRLHDAAEAKRALKLAQKNFDRVSLDLIYARPGQSVDAWRAELKEALSFGHRPSVALPAHHRAGDAFAALHRTGALVIPDDDHAAALYETTQEMTQAEGRPAYEISNHARPGEEARHNMLYWRYGDYAGAGPGAHGRLTLNGRRHATETERLPERWRHAAMKSEEIAQADAAREHLLMNLRLAEGLDLRRLPRALGLDAGCIARARRLADGGRQPSARHTARPAGAERADRGTRPLTSPQGGGELTIPSPGTSSARG